MADENATEGTENTASDAAQSDSAQLGEGGLKALDAERKRATEAEKTAKALQAQLDALNDAKLTETQRLQKQLDELAANYAQAQKEAIRNRVIASEGVPASLAGFLSGDDEDSLIASARALKSAVAEASKPGTPAPDPSQGSGSAALPLNGDGIENALKNALGLR